MTPAIVAILTLPFCDSILIMARYKKIDHVLSFLAIESC